MNGSFKKFVGGFALVAVLALPGCFADLNVNYVRADAAVRDRIEPITRQKITDDLAAGKITADQADDRITTLNQWDKMIADAQAAAGITVTATPAK